MSGENSGNNAGKTRGRPFAKGNSGRPKGSLNKTTIAAMTMLDGEATNLTRRAIELAESGDRLALKLVLDRILPVRRRPMVQFDLERLSDFSDVGEAARSIVQASLEGGLSPSEAEQLSKVVIECFPIIDQSELVWRAHRYIWALLERCWSLRERIMSVNAMERTPAGPPADSLWEAAPVEREGALKRDEMDVPLYLAGLAYFYDCKREIKPGAAWLALPSSEQALLREAAGRFPGLVEVPEPMCTG